MSAQTIRIHYHIGFDCTTEVNGEKVRGGCVTTERMAYVFKKKGKYFESRKLESVKEIVKFSDGKFRHNLEKDSLAIQRIDKKVKINIFNNLLSYIELIQAKMKSKEGSGEYYEELVFSNWDKKALRLSNREIRRIMKFAKSTPFNQDSVIHKITNYIIEKNKYLVISSVVEWIKISIDVNGINYLLSQSDLGGVNASWKLQIDDESFNVISPELNEIISVFLPNSMRAKRKIKQIFQITELEKAFLEETKTNE